MRENDLYRGSGQVAPKDSTTKNKIQGPVSAYGVTRGTAKTNAIVPKIKLNQLTTNPVSVTTL